MWCEQDSKRAKDVDMTGSDLEIPRDDGIVLVAQSTIVTGPSLTSSTAIRAPKTPVATSIPSARRASQKRS